MQTLAVAAAAPATRTRDVVARVRALADQELAPIAVRIDRDGHYPAAFLHAAGAAGAFDPVAAGDLGAAIEVIGDVSEVCLATGFLAWCQSALVWYLRNSPSTLARETWLARAASATLLGGTGLSNPMKSFFGIERLRLKARRAGDGYVVDGALPWVSNLGQGHVFGTIAERVEDGRCIFFLAECGAPGVEIKPSGPFIALEGTATYAVRFRNAPIPAANVLADPIDTYLPRIRAGFILLQCGMGLGLIRDCIAIMREVEPALGHVNRFLPVQPDALEEELAAFAAEAAALAEDPFDPSREHWRRVIALRLAAGEAALKAAQAAMLHAGARGYLASARPQRRLREAQFVAIVTPATKQLRKMLHDLDAGGTTHRPQ
jgi:alkylation response protein AidB-like acyl-CoA dehydrogenase